MSAHSLFSPLSKRADWIPPEKDSQRPTFTRENQIDGSIRKNYFDCRWTQGALSGNHIIHSLPTPTTMRLHFGKRWKKPIKVTGLLVLGIGILLNLGDLLGWFKHSARVKFLNWVLESPMGMPIETKPAIEFMKRFPPPPDARVSEITHLTKQRIASLGGPPMSASINYMHRDGTRTTYVATLEQVREWANESPYPWIAWSLTVAGFIIEVLSSTVLDRKENRKKPRPPPNTSLAQALST